MLLAISPKIRVDDVGGLHPERIVEQTDFLMLPDKKGVFSTKFTQKWLIHVDFSPKPILEPQSKQAKANKRRG